MPKQTIEVEVPEGYEFSESKEIGFGNLGAPYIDVRLFYKKKQPQVVEYKNYLSYGTDGTTILVFCATRGSSNPESYPGFIRWIETEWQRVEV